MLLTETVTGTLRKPTESELYTESEPLYGVALAGSGSTVIVTVCGVETLPPVPSDVCNHETCGITEKVIGTPVLVKVSGAVALVLACTVMFSGLGLIFSVCPRKAAPAAGRNTTSLGME